MGNPAHTLLPLGKTGWGVIQTLRRDDMRTYVITIDKGTHTAHLIVTAESEYHAAQLAHGHIILNIKPYRQKDFE